MRFRNAAFYLGIVLIFMAGHDIGRGLHDMGWWFWFGLVELFFGLGNTIYHRRPDEPAEVS